MQLKKYLLNKLPAITGLFIAFGLTSCGSYQYAGQDSDGIYTDNEPTKEVMYVEAEENSNNDYYKNYFKEKSLELEVETYDNDVFVDIDSYQGNYDEDIQSNGYGSWGENGNEVTINVYDNNYNNWGWTMPYWGWNRFGWNRSYYGWNSGFGYNGFGWNTGFGFSGGFYNPYWYPNYGYGYGYPYNFYNNSGYYYYRRGAYNTSRRNALASRYTTLNGKSYNTSASIRSNSSRTRSRVNTSTRPNNNSNFNTNTRTRSRVKTNSSTSPTRVKSNRTKVRNNITPTRTRTRVNSTPRSNRSYSSPSRSSSSSRASSGSRSSSRRRG